jgi:adenylate cyclase
MYAATAAVLTGVVLGAYAADVFHDTELDTVDARFSIRGDQKATDDIVVVAIDDVTFGELQQRWPFPRRFHARAVDRLREAGAKVVAYDVQFTEPSEDPEEDNALIEAVSRAKNVLLATTEVAKDGSTSVLGGEDVLKQFNTEAASGQFPNDPGGVLRRMYHDDRGLKTLGVRAAERFSGRPVDRGAFGAEDETAWVDYAGPPRTVKTVSFSRVVNGKVPAADLRGKIAVVGPVAPSLQDVHPTSASGEDLMAGAEIQANSAATALDGFPLSEVPGGVNVLLIGLLGLVGPVVAMRFGPVRAAIAGVLGAAAFAAAAQLAFSGGEIVSFVYPLASLLLGVVGALGVSVAVGAFERERVRDLFSRFVPEAVVGEVLANADEDLRLGGTRRVVTILFSDVRGFTTFSETRAPDEVIDVLNRYLTVMSDVVDKHQGALITYMGDGIMAAFGAPMDQPDHADRALAAAREMVGTALETFNHEVREAGLHDGFRIGVGLNSGPVMAGNVGSERRMEYTTIGDVTNTASRLEGMTKGSGWSVFVADSTKEMLTEEVDDLVHVDDYEVRGREAKITVWSIQEASMD